MAEVVPVPRPSPAGVMVYDLVRKEGEGGRGGRERG